MEYFSWKKAHVVEWQIANVGKRKYENSMAHAVAVNMFLVSSRGNPAHEQGSLVSVHKGSLWAKLQESCDEKNKGLGEKSGAGPMVKRRRTIKHKPELEWPFMDSDSVGAYLNTSLPGLVGFDDFACRYRVGRFLNKGSYGSVHLGETIAGPPVVVKIMRCRIGYLSGREVFFTNIAHIILMLLM